jgi:alginate O-acetyltransferase complex protein AlgI
MTLAQILIAAIAGSVWLILLGPRGRRPFLLVCSVIAVFWFQPPLAVRGLDFWLPVTTLGIAAMTWALTASEVARHNPSNWKAGALMAGLILLLGAMRFLPLEPILTAGRPPPLQWVALGLGVIVVLTFLAGRLGRFTRFALGIGLGFLVALLIVLKDPSLTLLAAQALRWLGGQPAAQASIVDLRWLGFSYIAFRLIHTIRDRQSGRLPDVDLAEYVTFVVFFPSLTAGPIDRIERFVQDLRNPPPSPAPSLSEGFWRLAVGLFKKFALADGLALMALSEVNVSQVLHAGWAWVMLYAYALRIYLDFAGYTDIAIGLARLVGIRLPENFQAPYLQPNLTQFWNRWHMTLTQWFRAYVFNPLTRRLRSLGHPLPATTTIFVAQMTTMVLIGLWHGVTWNFALWGAWHGVGLFAHNRWSEFARTRSPDRQPPPLLQATLRVGGTLLTFHYVALGWVFFALPTPAVSIRFFSTLFGVAT